MKRAHSQPESGADSELLLLKQGSCPPSVLNQALNPPEMCVQGVHTAPPTSHHHLPCSPKQIQLCRRGSIAQSLLPFPWGCHSHRGQRLGAGIGFVACNKLGWLLLPKQRKDNYNWSAVLHVCFFPIGNFFFFGPNCHSCTESAHHHHCSKVNVQGMVFGIQFNTP